MDLCLRENQIYLTVSSDIGAQCLKNGREGIHPRAKDIMVYYELHMNCNHCTIMLGSKDGGRQFMHINSHYQRVVGEV